MRRGLACLIGLAAVALLGAAAPEPSVLVTTVPARQGSLPILVTAFGSALPAVGGGMALSLPQSGRVSAIRVTQGERVAAGATLLEFERGATETSAFTQAQAALTLARAQRAHAADLLAQHLATRDQVAQADKAAADAQSALAALLRQGADQPHTALAAPFDAIVQAVKVGQGDRVAPGTPLLLLTRLDGLVVTVGVEPRRLAEIRPGQAATLHRLEAAGGTGAPPAAKVLRVDATLNPATRLVDVDLDVPAASVIQGELFRAEIETGAWTGWIVPHAAVLEDGKQAWLFQSDSGHARRVAVQVLGGDGAQDAVSGTLDAALPVIVQGATQIKDGAAVRTAP